MEVIEPSEETNNAKDFQRSLLDSRKGGLEGLPVALRGLHEEV